MKLTYSKECLALLKRLELFPKFIEETCQSPTRMMLTQSNPPQYYAAKWYDNPAKPNACLPDRQAQAIGRSTGDSGKVVFVHGILNKGKNEDISKQEMEVHCALELKENLPAGHIRAQMPMREIFLTVVKSFGVPVSCHPDAPPALLYNGRWDGKMVHCSLQRDEYYQVSGDFNLREGCCQDVWIFSFKLYKNWFVNG